MNKKTKRLGLAFSDQLKKINSTYGHFRQHSKIDSSWQENLYPNYRNSQLPQGINSWRILFLGVLIILSFFGLWIRIFHLQIVQGSVNRNLADSNRIKIKVIHAPRGVIYDRNGKVLAESNPGFRVGREVITREAAIEMEVKGDPRLEELEVDTIRSYPLKEVTAHVIGYVGELTDKELHSVEYQDYRLGDKVGRSGLEQIYQQFLRGKDGAEIIEVDSAGKKVRTIRRINPIPGNNLHLALDADLQQVAFRSLEQTIKKVGVCCGGLVGENPNNGEILVLASYPSFDNNAFTNPGQSQLISSYFNSSSSPLLNRAISGTYPPGSTFKITSSLAALSSGKFTEQTLIEDTGVMNLGPYKFANWYFTQYGKTEGMVDIVRALKRSNDIYYYRVGDTVGEKFLAEVAAKLGFGKRLGIDLPGEMDGLIPTPEWKEKTYGEVWYPGDNLHFAIGQGFLLTTPLQVLTQTAYVAAEGMLYQPHMVTKITRYDGSVVRGFKPEPIIKDQFSKDHLRIIKKGLEEVPKEGGTAWPFFNFTIPTAGKTGTSEFGDPRGRTHAWYTAYAPVGRPEITLTALVEAGGEGSSVASPIIKEILTWYFNQDKSRIKSLDLAPIATEAARKHGE